MKHCQNMINCESSLPNVSSQNDSPRLRKSEDNSDQSDETLYLRFTNKKFNESDKNIVFNEIVSPNC